MSEHDWKQTPALDEFNAMYDEDDNWWWRIACGHHQNLYEAAVERYERAEAQVQRVRDVCEQEFGKTGHQMMNPGRLGYRRALNNILDALDDKKHGWYDHERIDGGTEED